MGIRAEAVKQYKKSWGKRKKDIKTLKKQNKMLYIITNKSGSHFEIKNIKNIKSKASKKYHDDSSNSCSNKLDYNYSLSRNSYWDKHGWPAGHKEINSLDQIVTNNINTNKYQLNNAV